MVWSKIIYRINQFKLALWAKPSQKDLNYAKDILNLKQFELFTKLQDSEQAHAIAVCRQTEGQGHHQADLLTAALLHDIGKIRYPLRLWERVFIVIAKSFDTEYFEKRWDEEGKGLFRIFAIAAQHPAWGAELAKQVETSPMAVSLIQRHQDEMPNVIETEEDRLLEILQKNDNIN